MAEWRCFAEALGAASGSLHETTLPADVKEYIGRAYRHALQKRTLKKSEACEEVLDEDTEDQGAPALLTCAAFITMC